MKKKLQKQRAQLVREAEALKGQNGEFANDQARADFDAKMAEVEAIDVKLRALDAPADEPEPEDEPTPGEATATERARITGIQTEVRKHGLEDTFAAELVTKGVTLEAARGAILDKLAARDTANPTDPKITMGEDARDKWQRGAMAWLLTRSGMAGMVKKHDSTVAVDPGEFRGLRLMDLAREALTRAGRSVRGLDVMSLAGLAMTYRSSYQTTSDFANLLENTMHKILRAAYATQNDTWSRFCGTASVSDFRTHNWYRMGALGSLDTINEHGEFKNKSIPDAAKATFSATTKGNIIAVSRQTIVNDDLGALARLAEMLGRAGKLTIEKAVFTNLLLNSGLGPTQSDAQAFFHSNRANVNSSAAAITVASIEADRAVMRAQQDSNSQEYLDLMPSVLLVPVGKRGDALTINDAQFDPADNKFQKPNVVRGLFREVIDTPRLSGTRRYLFADPSVNPAILVSFLEGQQEPVLETQDGWRIDGVELKARLDFGVDFVDPKTAVTNAGA
jgi:hypothetical protein